MSWIALVYHEVFGRGEGTLPHFAVHSDGFAAQLDWLAASGYRVETLEQAAAQMDRRVVGLTFDDGHWSHHQHAFPLLAARGMKATFFVVSDWVGRKDYASWDQLREMRAAGMSIQSHSASHAYLSTLDVSGVRDELQRSKDALDRHLEQNTSAFALPGGDEPRRAWHCFGEVGYTMVATSRPGANGATPATTGGAALVRRLTVRHGQRRQLFHRLAQQDPRVLLTAQARHGMLDLLRRGIGRERYARWRRRFLDRLPGSVNVFGS